MALRFRSPAQEELFGVALRTLEAIGYSGALIEKDYSYPDWFTGAKNTIQAAAFGRTPVDYESALFGIALPNGTRGKELAEHHRALCAPILLEIGDTFIDYWAIGAHQQDNRGQFNAAQFRNWADKNRDSLGPRELLRTKNLGEGSAFYQHTLFAGLIPELEETIAETLDPLLKSALRAGIKTYSERTGSIPSESRLFTTVFWMLTGKVFADRKHPEFVGLRLKADPDEVLERVAAHYDEKSVVLLNRQTREAIFDRIWSRMDFQHLSVEVLAQVWPRFLVSKETRERLGIHRTPRSIVQYITDRIPFRDFDKDERIVVEPCSGTCAFLIGALNKLRDLLPPSYSPKERHAYFKRMLHGFERDAFGREIGRLCLALADYPEANGWDVEPDNVFTSTKFVDELKRSRVVLCNPPFGDFSKYEMAKYGAQTPFQPAELLNRILDRLHPQGVLGFVLPRTFIDGFGYANVRRRLVQRYDDIEVVALPDKAWADADKETALLIATNPNKSGRATVSYSVVREKQWSDFDRYQRVGASDSLPKTPNDAEQSIAVPELREVWEFLAYCDTIASVTERIARGVRWQHDVPLDDRESEKPLKGWHKGIPRKSTYLQAFQSPPVIYLDFRPEAREFQAFTLPWDRPKVLMNKAAKSRTAWRLAAFADIDEGLAAAQNYLALWPKSEADLLLITAVLNSPLANAFVTAHEGKTDITVETIERVPYPHFAPHHREAINSLVPAYIKAVNDANWTLADKLLREIDATVLDAYHLPPRLERKLLEYFRGDPRLVPFPFQDYFPAEFEAYFTLKEWLTGRPAMATVERFRSQSKDLPEHITAALSQLNEGEDS